MFFNKIKRLFSDYPLQTFTYFIPAPPERKQGYREKSFDQIIQKLTKMDFHIIDIKTQAINNNSRSGMWAIVTLRPITKAANEHCVSDFPSDEEILQNLAHLPTRNDNQVIHEVKTNIKSTQVDTPINGIDLPEDASIDDKDEIEGIYYID